MMTMADIIRWQQDRDLLAALAEWQRASGPDRDYWRGLARVLLREDRKRRDADRRLIQANPDPETVKPRRAA